MGRGGFRVELEGARLWGGGEQAALLSLFRSDEGAHEGAATRGFAADVFYRTVTELRGGWLRRGGIVRLLAFGYRHRGGAAAYARAACACADVACCPGSPTGRRSD